jgi:predicted Zn finger-like uncharacterized protein
MKIVCDACGSKYSIDDSRVSGKTFKVRCKQCSHVILLRGAPAPVTERVPEAEPVPEAGAWHVVLGETRVGPVAPAEVHRLRTTGKLGDGSLVWREGFDDWRALGTVDELRDSGRSSISSVEVAPELADAPASPRTALRNERNETSVLFSLGNLAKLAAPAPAAATAAVGPEGSGLLDIRSIARTMAPASAPAPAPARAMRGSLDDLPVYGPVTFVEPAVLIPRSHGRDHRLVWALGASIGTLAIVTTILVVLLVRNHGAARADALPAPLPTTVTSAPPPPATTTTTLATATAPSATTTPAATPDPTASPTTPAQATATHPSTPTASTQSQATATAQAAPVATTPSTRTGTAASRRTSSRTSAPSATSATSTTSATSATSPATPTSSRTTPEIPTSRPLQRTPESCSEVTCVVNGYADKCCEIYREHASGGTSGTSPATSLPDSLDRSAIATGIARIDTSGCRDKSPVHGNVTAGVKVSSDGTVTTVTVRSSPDEALSACVTDAVRKGTFARTQRGGSFAYVWRF